MEGYVVLMTVAAALMLLSAVLYFVTVFFGGFKKRDSKIKEKAFEAVADCSDGEFRIRIAKHMKEMEGTQKELIDVLKKQNTLLQEQIDNLQHEIYLLSEKQINQVKSIIRFNKENARQLAISERETLEYVMAELRNAIENNAGAALPGTTVERIPEAEEAPLLEEISEEELFEVSDLTADEEFVIPDLPAMEDIPDVFAVEETGDTDMEADIPELPDELDLSALFEDIAEAVAEENIPEEPAPAEEVKPEPVPAEDPLAGIGSDPNAMMTPEDIAKLLEAMGQ